MRPHAPDDATRDAILANPLYQNITGKFVQSHDYIAMERLYEIHRSGRYDLIVVDTPPTRNAIDFLEAPERMADFFSSRLLRWLIAPYRSRVVERRVEALLHDRRPHPGLAVPGGHRRVLHPVPDDVRRLRRAGRGREPQPLGRPPHDLRGGLHARGRAGRARPSYFMDAARRARSFHLGALVLNKVLPDLLRWARPPPRSARTLARSTAPRSAAGARPTSCRCRACRTSGVRAHRDRAELPRLPGGRHAARPSSGGAGRRSPT